MCQPAAQPAQPAVAARGVVPVNAAQAVALVRNGLDWLAAADPAELTSAERAEVLRGLAAAASVHLAATSRVLAAFDAAEDYVADGQGGSRTWLAWQTRATRPAAAAALAWTRRLARCPAVAGGLAAGAISPSYARRICDWADELPAYVRAAAARILVQAAAGGADLGDLAALFEEIRARTARPDTDNQDRDRDFACRELFLDSYYQGHGSLRADLTPPATAALQAVLDALGTRAGPEDTRTKAQRDHDALEEACRLLIASGCLPEREGQPVQIQLHMTLAQLLGHPETDPALAASLTARGATAPPGADCDAQLVPIVTGTINQQFLDDLADRYVDRGTSRAAASDSAPAGSGNHSTDADATPGQASAQPGTGAASSNHDSTEAGHSDAAAGPLLAGSDQTLQRARRAAAALVITDALGLLSGPSGLAAWLRSRQTGPAATISLPLDIGAATSTVPGHLRRAVTRRDQHCRFPGCDTPAVRCHVHHLRHRADGGETSVGNCCLLCPFHHLTAIHRWGWHLTLNPDGTTTASSPDGKRTFHSNAPPSAA
jgi:Domain of unknown function (DUF222)